MQMKENLKETFDSHEINKLTFSGHCWGRRVGAGCAGRVLSETAHLEPSADVTNWAIFENTTEKTNKLPTTTATTSYKKYSACCKRKKKQSVGRNGLSNLWTRSCTYFPSLSLGSSSSSLPSGMVITWSSCCEETKTKKKISNTSLNFDLVQIFAKFYNLSLRIDRLASYFNLTAGCLPMNLFSRQRWTIGTFLTEEGRLLTYVYNGWSDHTHTVVERR